MASRLHNTLLRALAVILVGASVVTGKFAFELAGKDIAFLLQDTQARDSRLVAWTARQLLATIRPTEADVRQLNRDAGARHIADLRDSDFAERMLRRFMAHGLDLEARDASGQWTALQLAVIDNDPDAARILMRHGARSDLLDGQGRDLRMLVSQFQEKLPDEDYRALRDLLRDEIAAPAR